MYSPIKPVRVRFAPSPTGRMHLGSARTALYNYLLAKQTGGTFILRIEDTDRKRYVAQAEQELIDGLHWLGIYYDEGPDIGGEYGPYRQSERKEIYQQYAQQLVEIGCAYYCFCSPERLEGIRLEQQKNKLPVRYDGTCRNIALSEAKRRINLGESYVIRFKTPLEGTTTVTDVLRGDITVDNITLDDYILVKSDGFALYHLAVVVDDHLMKISHVFRGAEWLPTFPLHGLITRAFGWEEPQWIHLSVFLKPSGKGKMSKREAAELSKDGYSIFVTDLKNLGYLPEAVTNWIALMGWSYDDHTEFFNMSDLIEKFRIDRLNPSPAAINFSKFDHFNGLHIRNLSVSDFAMRVKPFLEGAGLEVDNAVLLKVAPIIQERLTTLDDASDMAGFFFREDIPLEREYLVMKGLTIDETIEKGKQILAFLQQQIEFDARTLEPLMRMFMVEINLTAGQVFGFLRECITGQRVSPPIFDTMAILGKEKVLERVAKALQFLGSNG